MATPQERRAFGSRLRSLRKDADLTLGSLSTALKEQGEEFTPAAISGWERGEYAPKLRTTVLALEATLRAPGQLAPLLGLSRADVRRGMDAALAAPVTVGDELHMAASGDEIDRVRAEDPEYYELLLQLARQHLDR